MDQKHVCDHTKCTGAHSNQSLCQTLSEMDWERGLWYAGNLYYYLSPIFVSIVEFFIFEDLFMHFKSIPIKIYWIFCFVLSVLIKPVPNREACCTVDKQDNLLIWQS